MSAGLICNIFDMGLIFSLVTIGVFLSYRLSDFPDLGVDGTFPLGAAVTAKLLLMGVNPVVALVVAAFGGSAAGFITGRLHAEYGVMSLLAGIIVMTALYSINIRIMGSSNLAFFHVETIFSGIKSTFLLFFVVFGVLVCLTFLLNTHWGLGLRASGSNPQGSTALGISVSHMKQITLAISNGIVALSGSLFAQLQGFSDVSMGGGIIIGGIASLIIGESLLRQKNIGRALLSCLTGSLLYRGIVITALSSSFIGLQATDLHVMTAFIILCVMLSPKSISLIKLRWLTGKGEMA